MDNLIFEPMRFVENLPTMGIGMLGVFMIIFIIAAATYAIGAIGSKKDATEDDE